MLAPSILAIDQGTTSTRAVAYHADTFGERGSAQKEFTQHYPRPGWVEHDPEEIWQTVADVVPAALARANWSDEPPCIGITNQRETVILWERATGKPVGRGIVWQDRRTTEFCRERAADQPWLQGKTGLVLDPYFSATKIRWLLDQDPALRAAAERGAIACGTVDSFLVWRLTGGQSHVTDLTNAARTLLLNIHTLNWDDELLHFFGVPRALLPEVKPSTADFGVTRGLGFLPDGIPIRGVAGDQQAALFGQCGFAAGDAKCTYGTGAFFLVHTGDQAVASRHQLLTTVAAMTGRQPRYALEGSVFVAGAAVQWLRDGLKMFEKSADVEALAGKSNPEEPVIFVPAFVGLGAPYWAPEARGAILGLTRGTTNADIARAALEGVAFEVADLIDAAVKDTGRLLEALRVDGGMTRNDWFLQCQADTLGLPVLRSPVPESTALGAAFLAALGQGLWKDEADLRAHVGQPRRFDPQLPETERQRRLERWRRAVRAVIGFDNAAGPSVG